MDMQLVESKRGGQLEVDSVRKGTGLYLAKREGYDNTSSSVAKRTNLLPSQYLT